MSATRKRTTKDEEVSPWKPVTLYTEWFDEEQEEDAVGNQVTILKPRKPTTDKGSIDIREICHFFEYRSEAGNVVPGVFYVYMRNGNSFPIIADVGDLYRWRQVGDIMRRNELLKTVDRL